MRREAESKSHLENGLVWTPGWTFGIGDHLHSLRGSPQVYLEIRLDGGPVDEDNESPRNHQRSRGVRAAADHGGGWEIVLVVVLGWGASGSLEATRALHPAAFGDVEPRIRRLRSV